MPRLRFYSNVAHRMCLIKTDQVSSRLCRGGGACGGTSNAGCNDANSTEPGKGASGELSLDSLDKNIRRISNSNIWKT